MKKTAIYIVTGLVIVIAIVVIVRWKTGSIPKPPLAIAPSSLPVLDSSYIALPLQISSYDILRAIRSQLNGPVLSGVSPEIDAKLLATEPISTTNLIKEEVSPFIPGHDVTYIKQVMKPVHESYSCALPWKWGTCWRDVLKPFSEVVHEWVAPQEAIYRYTSKVITNIIDKTYDVGAWVHYDIYVDDIDLHFDGNKITIQVKTKTSLVFDYKQPVVPLGPTVTIKGITHCDVYNSFTLSAGVGVTDSMALAINLDEDNTTFNFDKVCNNFAITGIDIATYITPAWIGYKKLVGSLFHKAIISAINKKIDDNQSALAFKDKLNDAALMGNTPRLVDKNIWLIPNVSRVSVGDFSSSTVGDTTFLQLTAGLVAKPIILYSADTPKIDIPAIAFDKKTFAPKVHGRIDAGLDYQFMGTTMTDTLKKYTKSQFEKLQLQTGKVNFYPSNDKLVASIDIDQVSGKTLTTIYVWGIPRFDPEKSIISIDSPGFYLKSENELIKLANAGGSQLLLSVLQKRASWAIEPELSKARKKIHDIYNITEMGILSGSINQLNITNLVVGQNRLSAYVDVEGDLSFRIRPLKFFIAPAIDTSKQNTAKATQWMADSAHIPINHVGQTITEVINNAVHIDMVTFQNKSLPGDTIFYYDKTGVMNYYILTHRDIESRKPPMFGASDRPAAVLFGGDYFGAK